MKVGIVYHDLNNQGNTLTLNPTNLSEHIAFKLYFTFLFSVQDVESVKELTNCTQLVI